MNPTKYLNYWRLVRIISSVKKSDAASCAAKFIFSSSKARFIAKPCNQGSVSKDITVFAYKRSKLAKQFELFGFKLFKRQTPKINCLPANN